MDFYTRGIEKFRNGDNHGAIQDLTQAIKMNPNFAPAYSVCGGAYFALGDYQGAIACHDQAIRLDPKLAESYGDRALARYELGDKQGAIVDFTQSIQLNPNLAYSFYGRGITCFELGEISGILADFQKAATLFLQQEDIRGREQRLHEIQQYYRQYGIGFLDSNAKDAMEQGIKELRANNPDRAIHNFVRAIQFDPNLADAYFLRGTVYMGLGSNREAIEDFTQAIAQNPTLADAYYNRGCIYFDLGNSQEAIEDFTQSIKLDPYLAKAYYNRGSSYLSQRNQQAAITDLQRAVELFDQQGDKQSYEGAIRQIKKLQMSNTSDKDKRIILCLNCEQKLRVPNTSSHLNVKCPQCSFSWLWKPYDQALIDQVESLLGGQRRQDWNEFKKKQALGGYAFQWRERESYGRPDGVSIDLIKVSLTDHEKFYHGSVVDTFDVYSIF